MKNYAFIKFPFYRVTIDIRFYLILRAIFFFTLYINHTRFNYFCDFIIVFIIVGITKNVRNTKKILISYKGLH